MRNIFDQYSQPENRVTHALLVALDQDRELLASFLRDLLHIRPPVPARQLQVHGQGLRQDRSLAGEDPESGGIPDGWIHDDDEEWCIAIESKVTAPLRAGQLESHRRTAESLDFKSVVLLAIVPHRKSAPEGCILLEWGDVYAWLRSRMPSSEWAGHAAAYLEIAEAQLIEKGTFVDGKLTRFSGILYGERHPYTWADAKRVLGLATELLKQRADLRKLGVDPSLAGRPKITGRHDGRVWDMLSLRSEAGGDFTSDLHLTLGIHDDMVVAMVTIPNNIDRAIRARIVAGGEEPFLRLVSSIVGNLSPLLARCPGASPRLKAVQRRYSNPQTIKAVDASIDFDLRTALGGAGDLKPQPIWLSAAYQALADKAGNYQMQIGVYFPYKFCAAELGQPSAIDLIAAAWIACKPLIYISHG